MDTATGYTIAHSDDFERPFPKWALARRSLGITSFGMNLVELEPGEQIPEHDETARDHEEVFIAVEGNPAIVIDGTRLPLPAGTFARLDPEPRRYVVNDGEGRARVLIVSAPRTSGYEPPEWA